MEIKSKKNNKNNNIVRIIALIVLCFVFCLPLFACNDPIYNHVISVTSSNIQKGTVSGSGTYKTNKNVTLTATPKSGYSFIAWIKNEVIVSQDAEFTFTANKETEGKYTALFTTDTLEFFMITNYMLYLYTLPKEEQIEQIFIILSFIFVSALVCMFLDYLKIPFTANNSIKNRYPHMII